ncbi:MAG: glycosyltransferase family 2 protein [Acidimicrobiia bacterium]
MTTADAMSDVFGRLSTLTGDGADSFRESTGRHPAGGDGRERPRIRMRPWNYGLVSVIIVVTNRRRDLETVLRSLQTIDGSPAEIVVIDDGSTDGTWAWLQRNAKNCVARRNEAAVGFNDAATQGINESNGQFIGVIDLTGPLDQSNAANHTVVPRTFYETLGRYQR